MYLGAKGAVPKNTKTNRSKSTNDKRGAGLKEKEIQKQCEELINDLGLAMIRIPDTLYSRVFGIGSRVSPKDKAFISSFIKGVPDITILLRDGRYICIELKTATGKMSQGQKNFERKLGEDNYHVVRSQEGLIELLRKYGAVL